MIELFDIIITTGALLALLIASISDIKTREIPDWVSYGLFFFVISTRLLESLITKTYKPITTTLIVFIIFFLFGNIMYFTKQWGGGDTKLIAAIGTAFAQRPGFVTGESILPFPAILLLNILIIGAIYGIIYAMCLGFKNKENFKKQFLIINAEKNIRRLKICILSLSVFIVLTSFIFLPKEVAYLGGMLALILLILPYLMITLKSIEFSCMFKKLKPSQLTEGDWVQENIYKGKKLIYKSSLLGIDKKSIQKLKKEKIKLVLIKEGIPFVPPFLVGTITTLLTGGVIFFSII